MSDAALHVKYRPDNWANVLGQRAIVSSMRKEIERRAARTFLLAGPSGCGKTTLARIAANALGCDIVEVDAATNTGIDQMRVLQDGLQYKPLGGGRGRAMIIDEAHGLSRQAWNSLLKVTEEPPAHVWWFFCTTEPTKVPPTIHTRSVSYTLKLLTQDELWELLAQVCDDEEIELADGVDTLVVREARGSARQLLVNLAKCRDAKDRRAAADLLRTVIEGDGTLELCRFLVKGGSWTAAMKLLTKLEGENPESVRIVVCNYLAAVLKNAKSDRDATHALTILEHFATPYIGSDNMAPLYLSIGRCLFSEA